MKREMKGSGRGHVKTIQAMPMERTDTMFSIVTTDQETTCSLQSDKQTAKLSPQCSKERESARSEGASGHD